MIETTMLGSLSSIELLELVKALSDRLTAIEM